MKHPIFSNRPTAALHLIYIIAAATLVSACSEQEGMVFSDHARVQLTTDATGSFDEYAFSFVWQPQSVVRDTVFLPVAVLGGPADTDRHVRLEQVMEQDVEYTRDRNNYIVDSIVTPRTDQAVAGQHYVDFGSSEYRDLLTVPAGKVQASIGIILLRDASLAEQSRRLRIRLAPNDDFLLGESRYLERTLVFSDLVERPAAWTDQSWNAFQQSYGNYSRTKHLFMIQVVGGKVDDAWFVRAEDSSFRNYWRMKFIEALTNYNADPANIAAGLAPMREDPDNINSALITFPNGLN